ncbi:family 10 glycosyl hydrolase [Tirmania nivea]|nr:family 10 glycosyl hydrolase [Tirmania nivea]
MCGRIEKSILDKDAPYAAIAASKEFSQVTHENTVKWETSEPQPGVFDFTHNMKVRGHTLVWHSQLAPWVTANNYCGGVEGRPRMTTLVTHFKGRVSQWDVVNEAFNEDGTFRESTWYKTFGEDYIEWAFRWARKADPKAKLYINDYNFEGASPKTEAVTNLVRKLKAKGVPIDSIGVHGHLIVGSLSDSIEETWRTWSGDLGVGVAVTELDIRLSLPETEENLQQQTGDYTTVVKACMNVKRCHEITFWQFTPGESLEKKPAYYAIAKALQK